MYKLEHVAARNRHWYVCEWKPISEDKRTLRAALVYRVWMLYSSLRFY